VVKVKLIYKKEMYEDNKEKLGIWQSSWSDVMAIYWVSYVFKAHILMELLTFVLSWLIDRDVV
jgi:hypothetical protein